MHKMSAPDSSSPESLVRKIKDLYEEIERDRSVMQEALSTGATIENSLAVLMKKIFEYRTLRRGYFALVSQSFRVVQLSDDLRDFAQSLSEHRETSLDNFIREILRSTGSSEKEIADEMGEGILSDFVRSEHEDELTHLQVLAYGIVERRYMVPPPILGDKQIPAFLEEYFGEARECFAFDQFIATTVLCRAIIEICVYDIERRRVPNSTEDLPPEVEYRNAQKPSTLRVSIGKSFSEWPEVAKRLHKLLDYLNKPVHGNLIAHGRIGRERAKQNYVETLALEQFSKVLS